MKVHEIIQEGIGSKFLGFGGKQTARQFATKAEELAFQTAVDRLSNEIVRQLRRGEITNAGDITNPWRYISTDLSGTKWASDKSWMTDVFFAGIKDANEKFAQLTSTVGATAAKVGVTAAAVTTGSVFLTGVKTAINVLLAYEIFSNVDEVFNNPKNGYMTMMKEHERWLKSSEQTPERIVQFENAHRETLKIAVGRLAFQSPTLLLGGALAIFKVLILLKTGALTLIGFKKVAAGLNALGGFVSYGAKSVLAGYLAFLNSDIPIIDADINSDGEKESLRPLDAIKWLIVNDAFFVVGKAAGVAAGLAGPIEQALILAYEDLIEKYGVDINTGLSTVGAKPLPNAVPGSNKSLGKSSLPVPSAGPPTAEKFNPTDWKKLKSGMYQHRLHSGQLLHPSEFAAKSQ